MNTKAQKFDEAAAELPDDIRRILCFVPENIKTQATEIRLRACLPVALTVNGKTLFLKKSGDISETASDGLLTPDIAKLKECFLSLCRHSVYDHAEELKEGYIYGVSGNRVGVCGRLLNGGAVTEVTSLNIRIAHEVIGCADGIVKIAQNGILIAGPPGCGKTTLLRDLVRQLSSSGKRVAVIDGRGEISGGGKNNLGENTDVIRSDNKAKGVEIALRTLFPQMIAFDEIGTESELCGVKSCFCSGVFIITTVHAGSVADLKNRGICASLLASGAIPKVAMLSRVGKDPCIYSTEDII